MIKIIKIIKYIIQIKQKKKIIENKRIYIYNKYNKVGNRNIKMIINNKSNKADSNVNDNKKYNKYNRI